MENLYECNLKVFSEDEDMNTYNKELEEDVKINKRNITEKSMNVSAIRCKWLNRLEFERENLKKLVKAKEKYTKKKISTSNITDPLIKMKSTVALENGDETMEKINSLMKKVKDRIEFLERVQNIVGDMSYSIRNSIELFKMEGL